MGLYKSFEKLYDSIFHPGRALLYGTGNLAESTLTTTGNALATTGAASNSVAKFTGKYLPPILMGALWYTTGYAIFGLGTAVSVLMEFFRKKGDGKDTKAASNDIADTVTAVEKEQKAAKK